MRTVSAKSQYIWNLIGCTMNAVLSVILLLGVNRLAGSEAGGLFSFAFANAQVFQYIALFEVRPFHVTDVERKYTFSTYFTLRLVSCTLMLLAGGGYILLTDFSLDKKLLLGVLCLYKALEAFSDLFAAAYQQQGRIDLGGMNMTFRTTLVMASFLIVMATTNDLLIASVSMCASVVVSTVGFDCLVMRQFPDIRCRLRFSQLRSIVLAVLPLAAASVLRAYTVNAPKYAIDRVLGDAAQNRYGILFLPAMVVNLFGTFLFYPKLHELTEDWKCGRYRKLSAYIRRLMCILAGATVAGMAAAVFLGIPILSALYNTPLGGDRGVMALLMLFGGLNAAEIFLYYVVVSIRKQVLPVIVYAASSALSAVLSVPLVRTGGLIGAGLMLVIVFSLITVTYGIYIALSIQKAKGD